MATVILPHVLFGCETSPLTRREVHRPETQTYCLLSSHMQLISSLVNCCWISKLLNYSYVCGIQRGLPMPPLASSTKQLCIALIQLHYIHSLYSLIPFTSNAYCTIYCKFHSTLFHSHLYLNRQFPRIQGKLPYCNQQLHNNFLIIIMPFHTFKFTIQPTSSPAHVRVITAHFPLQAREHLSL